MVLIYPVRSFLAEWKSSEQRTSITWTNCHFGGRRPWFTCSAHTNGRYCGRRVAVLYLAGQLVRVPRLLWLGLRRHMPMPYRATLPVRSKRGAVHSASRFCLPIATPRAPAPFRAVCLWPKNSVFRQRRLGFGNSVRMRVLVIRKTSIFAQYSKAATFQSFSDLGAGWGLPPKRASGPRAA